MTPPDAAVLRFVRSAYATPTRSEVCAHVDAPRADVMAALDRLEAAGTLRIRFGLVSVAGDA